jgi:hypothetical protein
VVAQAHRLVVGDGERRVERRQRIVPPVAGVVDPGEVGDRPRQPLRVLGERVADQGEVELDLDPGRDQSLRRVGVEQPGGELLGADQQGAVGGPRVALDEREPVVGDWRGMRYMQWLVTRPECAVLYFEWLPGARSVSSVA